MTGMLNLRNVLQPIEDGFDNASPAEALAYLIVVRADSSCFF